jgi:hypothetical protein
MSLNPISNTSYPLDGVTIHQMNNFVEECGGKGAFKGKTTEEVNKLIQKPITLSKKVSYCNYLNEKYPDSIHKTNVFISHAWKYKFLDVV